METRILIALIIVVLLVVGINGILILMMRKNKPSQHVQMWQKAARRARNPWEDEDNQLKELSERVRGLSEASDQPGSDSAEENQGSPAR